MKRQSVSGLFIRRASPRQKELSLSKGVKILIRGYYAVAGTETEFDPDNRFGCPTLLWTAGSGGLDGQEFLLNRWFGRIIL